MPAFTSSTTSRPTRKGSRVESRMATDWSAPATTAPSASTRRSRSPSLLQQNEQWAAAAEIYRSDPRGGARPCRCAALLRRARPSAGAERGGSRADREEPRARARSGGLAQQSRDRPAGSAQTGRGDRRVSSARSHSIRITPMPTTISAWSCGRQDRSSKRKRHIEPPFASIPTTRMRTTTSASC